MRRILRRNLVRDAQGRPLSVASERLTDDGQGALHQTAERTASRCSGCHRPVTELSELRGRCDACGARECCVHCVARCAACSRRLCGSCRRGFEGPPALTVCATCQGRLAHRQLLQDQQLAFDRELARHRLHLQEQALRLNYERAQWAAEAQAARLGLNSVWWPVWVARKAGGLLTSGIGYAWRSLR